MTESQSEYNPVFSYKCRTCGTEWESPHQYYYCPKCFAFLTSQKEPKEQKESILDEANKIINGERQDAYGNPEDSFKIIADLWDVYLRSMIFVKNKIDIGLGSIGALDVAHMMALFKIARMLGQAPKRDNYIDCAGYIAIAGDRLLGGS